MTTPFVWPVHDNRPLDFIAQINLRDLARCHRFDWLPDSGTLLFFYDVEEQPWGFDPSDTGSWAVIHLADDARDPVPLTETTAPVAARLHRVDVTFTRIHTFPSDLDGVERFAFTDAELDIYADHCASVFAGRPAHQIGGFAQPVQGDMELECELVSNGIHLGDSAAYARPMAEALELRALEWRLLLQMDSDEAANAMWGDLGRLYFWIREGDARAGRFERAWVVLQCH